MKGIELITYLNGDVTEANFGIIAYVCNNIGVYNKGVAKCIRDKFPIAYEKYRNLGQYQIGVVHFVKVSSKYDSSKRPNFSRKSKTIKI